MSEPFTFRFTTPDPPPPDGRPITAKEAEQLFLHQLQTKQRPEMEVLWDLVWLYSKTDNQDRAFAIVQPLAAKSVS